MTSTIETGPEGPVLLCWDSYTETFGFCLVAASVDYAAWLIALAVHTGRHRTIRRHRLPTLGAFLLMFKTGHSEAPFCA